MRVAILGAGKAGLAIARQALVAGHDVAVASRDRDDLDRILDFVAPGAVAMRPDDAIDASDLTVLSIPLNQYRRLPLDALADRTVIDAMNYWPPVDGRLDAFDTGEPSSVVMQRLLPTSRVVKTLNHVGYADLEPGARP